MSITSPAAPAVEAEAFCRMVAETMPIDPRFRWKLVGLQYGSATLDLAYDVAFVRPGGTISGPTMFTLADLALWAATLSVVGMQPLAVTSHLSISFLRRPAPTGLRAHCEVLKTGRRLVHGDVRITSEGSSDVVCHATGAYAVPVAGGHDASR